MWIDCPMCGKEKSAWEDDNGCIFCGDCEEKYRREQEEYQEVQDALLAQ